MKSSVVGTSQSVSAGDFNERAKLLSANKFDLGDSARKLAADRQKQAARSKRPKPQPQEG